MRPVHCRLCGVYYSGEALWQQDGLEVRKCPRCRFITTWPLPTKEQLALYYSDEYFSDQHREVEDWNVGRRGIFRQIAALLLSGGISGDDLVLDVGCGYGFLLRYLSAHGFRCEVLMGRCRQ